MNPFVIPSTITQLYVAASVSMLVYYNSIRRRHYVTRTGILPTTVYPWNQLSKTTTSTDDCRGIDEDFVE